MIEILEAAMKLELEFHVNEIRVEERKRRCLIEQAQKEFNKRNS